MGSPPRYVRTRLGPSSRCTRSWVPDIALSRGRPIFGRHAILGALRNYNNSLSRSWSALTTSTASNGHYCTCKANVDSAFRGRCWHAIWVYFAAPTLGMLGAAELFLWGARGHRLILCQA